MYKDYDIPKKLISGSHSQAFSQFMHHWFRDSWGLSRREVNLKFLEQLTESERELAKNLLRRNLHLKYTHIIEGIAALKDTESIPALREMLAREQDLSWQLTITGTLWKLAKDSSFVECLYRMKESNNATLKQAHIHQVSWLSDERAVDLLIDLLDDSDSFVRALALSQLNELEFGQLFPMPSKELPRQAEDYRNRRNDEQFRKMMVKHLIKYNEKIAN